MYKASILICSLNRKESLNKLLKSLKHQTRKDFEILICEEEGELVELKDRLVEKAKGEIIIFLDDDVECYLDWFENMMKWFDDTNAIGVTGPTYVPPEFLTNRDALKGGWYRTFYNYFFLEGRPYVPGKITSCGANTIGGSFPGPYTTQMWFVDFLEPSAFGVRKWAIDKVGLDRGYTGVGEWFDTDLCYRIKGFGPLIFAPDVKVIHRPVMGNTYEKRLVTWSRYKNYCRWADKFIDKSFKHYLYRLFLKIYFFLKGRGWI